MVVLELQLQQTTQLPKHHRRRATWHASRPVYNLNLEARTAINLPSQARLKLQVSE
eukprot:m.145223 g.145223  ORF g.145223 m.145223 type:complete len:56 (-) comp30428_c0_seq2:1500-1667(-)